MFYMHALLINKNDPRYFPVVVIATAIVVLKKLEK